MEGAPNDRASTDPPMTPIERQMQAIKKGPPTPRDNKLPLPRGENGSNDQEADSRQVTRHREDKAEKTPPHNRHRAESAGSSAPPNRHRTARTTRSSKQLKRPNQSSKQPERPDQSPKKSEQQQRSSKQPKRSARLKVKAARNLHNLVHRADSPFIPSIANFPLPSRFKAVPEEIMCRAFPMGLRGSARVWFNKLELESIGSFVQLSRAFIDHFIGSQRRGRPPTHLLSVKQMEGESLRAFVHRFNEEAMKIDHPKEDVTITAFMAGLRKGDFLYDLCKDPPETLSELMYEAQKHMNAEDALEAMDDPPPKKRKDTEDRKQEPTKQKVPQGSWTPHRRLRSLKGASGDTHLTGPAKNACLDDQVISFSEEDARGTHQPHDDALVVTINIASFTTRRVMVDNGSSADIRYLTAYQQMKLDKDKLRPMDAPLVGFTRDKVAARECYLASLGSEGQNQTMAIEEHKILVKPSEKLDTVVLEDGQPERTTKIGSNLPPKLKESLVQFLKNNKDVFSWSHEDMPERNNAIMEEVDKLLAANFIREVFYPNWLANVVMNAGATYQRLMNRMFHDQIGRNVEVYVDDMLVKSKEEGDHLDDLRETFKTLHKYQMKLNPSKCAFGVYSGKFLGFMVSQRGIEANPDKIKAILEMQPPRTTKKIQRLTRKVAALNRFMSRSTDKCLPFFKTLKKAFEWTDKCQQAFEELKRYLTKPPLLSPSKQGKKLYLYLAVSPIVVSSALI
uniref:Reverse transcriptase domain-containing protein n=1 Tax=Fagus sylvatica TaxID=28930 RepID=A0A2N9GJM9_FAGSY